MAEYIEMKKLEEAFDNADPDVCESYPYGNSYWGFGRENVRDVIRGVPAADVAPVVHGRWITWEEAGNDIPSPHRHECSVCHDAAQVLINGIELLSDYCPNCGAIMDGDAERRNT